MVLCGSLGGPEDGRQYCCVVSVVVVTYTEECRWTLCGPYCWFLLPTFLA